MAGRRTLSAERIVSWGRHADSSIFANYEFLESGLHGSCNACKTLQCSAIVARSYDHRGSTRIMRMVLARYASIFMHDDRIGDARWSTEAMTTSRLNGKTPSPS